MTAIGGRDIVVIGGSAGAIEGTVSLIRALPRALAATIAVVVHHNQRAPNVFGPLLDRIGTLPVTTVADRAPLEAGRVYVPVSDHHLIMETGWLLVSRTARENRARPAIDPLFRSAARAYGRRVVGVILSGNLDDGAAGLLAIHQAGGMTVVQDPSDAVFPGMPSSALAAVPGAVKVPLSEIPRLLLAAVAGDSPMPAASPQIRDNEKRSANGNGSNGNHGSPELGAAPPPPPGGGPVSLTCPTCHGAVGETDVGGTVVFNCHTGHTFGIDSMLAAQDEDLEMALWSSVRALQEKVFFIDRLTARDTGPAPNTMSERRLEERARLLHHVATLRRMLEVG